MMFLEKKWSNGAKHNGKRGTIVTARNDQEPEDEKPNPTTSDMAKLSTEANLPLHAYIASAQTVADGVLIPGTTQTTEPPFTNVQLAFWKDAKRKYEQRIRNVPTPDLADMVLVVVALLSSLTFLFGRNYNEERAPELLQMVNCQRWKLKKLRPDLYKALRDMFRFYRNILKHPSGPKMTGELHTLDKAMVSRFMENTRKIWRWFIERFCELRHVIPDEQFDEFQDSYI